jgi:hypothetical protein
MVFRIAGVFGVLGLLLASCKGKDEPIPSYVHIDSLSIQASAAQGNAVHDIRFVYAYVDGELLGVFELPATIPVLKDGKHTFTVSPAVALNGSNNQLAQHTGFLPTDSSLVLTRGKVATYSNPVLKFRTNVEFVWLEDFEDNSSTVSAVAKADEDTTFIEEYPFELNGRFVGSSKVYRAKIAPSDTFKYLDLASFKAFTNLPNNATDIFLEFDIRSDIPVQLALKRSNSSGVNYVPYLYIYSTDKIWKRFYVNLNYETGGQPAGSTYQIFFSSDIGASADEHLIQLDNIRLSFNN